MIMRKNKVPYYTVYLNKSDKVVAFGRSEECAAMLGLTMQGFYSILYHCRNCENPMYAVVIDKEEV